MKEIEVPVRDGKPVDKSNQDVINSGQLGTMIRNSMFRHLEATQDWVACGGRDQYLMQSGILKRPESGKL